MENLNEREARLGLKTVLEVEAHKTRKNAVWYRLVTIESNGLRHVLCTWKEGTPAYARKVAKLEGVELVQVES